MASKLSSVSAGSAPVEVIRERADGSRWEVASRPPAERLRDEVLRYQGYAEQSAGVARRRHYPLAAIPLIITLGPPLAVASDGGRPETAVAHDAFIAGIHDRFSMSEFPALQRGVQVDFTPLGAYRLLGRPMSEIAGQVVELADVFGSEAIELRERLYAAPDWGARFDVLDAAIEARLARGQSPTRGLEWAWGRLQATGGTASIAGLAGSLGWSHRRQIAGFREEVGIAPKVAARIVRFEYATRLIDAAPAEVRWVDLAVECGYYDQAHLVRDFKRFTGEPPTQYLARLLPEGGGVSGD
ncbi:MAG: helix-turn-helix domain-containing protein [Dehalococcoidia bacterium]|nr:helix-turn-helix domain-containing protein [Dehalococcoidia bacterium]